MTTETEVVHGRYTLENLGQREPADIAREETEIASYIVNSLVAEDQRQLAVSLLQQLSVRAITRACILVTRDVSAYASREAQRQLDLYAQQVRDRELDVYNMGVLAGKAIPTTTTVVERDAHGSIEQTRTEPDEAGRTKMQKMSPAVSETPAGLVSDQASDDRST